jgi:tetratricopeptide (TPR) repeat protein
VSPSDQLALADYYIGIGSYADSRPLLDALITDPALTAQVHLRRAVIADRQGDAARALSEAAAASPDPAARPFATLITIQVQFRTGNSAEAIKAAQELVGTYPRWTDARFALAVMQWQVGDGAAAVHVFHQLQEDARYGRLATVYLTQIALERGDTHEAVTVASSVPPSLRTSLTTSMWARALCEAGDLRGATRVLLDGKRRWPQAVALEIETAYLAFAERQLARARILAERARTHLDMALDTMIPPDLGVENATSPGAPRPPSLHVAGTADGLRVRLALLLARVAIAEHDMARAEQILSTLEPSLAEDVGVLQMLGEIALARGDAIGARHHFERALERRPQSTALLTTVGMLREQTGDPRGAQAVYARAYEHDKQAGIAANNLASLLALDGHLDAAIRAAQDAERALKGAAPALDTLGWIYHLAGRQQDAITWLARARDKAPRSPLYRYHLGTAYAKAGAIEEARLQLRESLQLSADFPEREKARALLSSLN